MPTPSPRLKPLPAISQRYFLLDRYSPHQVSRSERTVDTERLNSEKDIHARRTLDCIPGAGKSLDLNPSPFSGASLSAEGIIDLYNPS